MRFDSYHPAINLLYFTAVIAAAVGFDHPAFLLIGYLCAFVYSVALDGKRALVLNLLMLPLMALYAGYYGFYNHFGVTVLSVNFIGNRIMLESLVYGAVLSVKAATVLMWMECVHAVFSSDKVVYLLGRVSPRLSLYLSLLLRLVPRIRRRRRKIGEAQHCIGRDRRLFRKLSILITWTLEDLESSSTSMESRGVKLRGRTAFSIYRFDNRDRAFVIALCALYTLLLMAAALDQTRTLYAPELVINPVSPLSFVFYAGYTAACLLPLILQRAGEQRFRRLLRR